MNTYDDILIKNFIRDALREDLSDIGDVTSHAIFSDNDTANAIIKTKESGILSGTYLIEKVFKTIDPTINIQVLKDDGNKIEAGEEICRISGKIITILSGERLILNLLQRLSGIATSTNKLVKLISHTKSKLLDTRKTTPLLRLFEKNAVVHGGGTNHRFGLFDMIMIKDTHVKAAGGPGEAVKRAKSYCRYNSDIKIEVEVQDIKEFNEAIRESPHRIMLDNMNTEDMKICVEMRNSTTPEIELEASGNVNQETIKSIAETGVDYISVGAITHSVTALDIHLVII